MGRDYTDEDLAGLTAAEREQLQALDAEETAAQGDLEELAGEDDDGADEDAGDNADDEGDDEEGAADDDGEDDAPAGAGTEQGDDGDEQPAARAASARPADAPIYTAAVPADAEAQLKAIDDWKRGELGKVNAERAALLKQFNDGDLDADAFSAADAKLLDRRDEIGEEATRRREPIVLAVNRAQVAAEMTQQQMLNAWKATFTSFFAEQKSAGFDYRAEANKDALAFFDARVKALADAYEDTPEGWKDLLADAHALTARKFGIPEPKPAKAAEAKPDSKPEPKARTSRQPDLSKVPPTIGRAPAAANPNVSGNEFAHLDGLDGVALEKAVMKMSKEQQERWANA